jgi:UDP-2,3-diacylglucosamine hydrolase
VTTRLFLSDLHLHDSRPQITDIFLQFLNSEYIQNEAELYILGDLFEFWAGDDAGAYPHVLEALSDASNKCRKIYFMPGNRDFLVGRKFEHDSGCQLLPDPTVISVDGENILLMHGDTLCTDDIRYQEFRSEVRSREWQQRALSMPLTERIEYFQSLRETSQKSIQEIPDEIMDVNQQSVTMALEQHHCRFMIHGHTHRQSIHHHAINGESATRIVLGDWYESGNVLLLHSPSEYRFIDLLPGD